MASHPDNPAQVRVCGRRLALEFTPGEVQSLMDTADPYALLLAYARAMMCFVLFQPQPAHIIMVGLGGGSLVKFCHRYLPACRITVLELRADVIALRERFAIPPDDARLQILQGDASVYMRGQREVADVILLDGFDANGLPPTLTTPRFYADCRRALRPGGVLVANVFSYDRQYRSVLVRLGVAFQERLCQLIGIAGNNHILFAIRPGPQPGSLASRMQRRVAAWGSPTPGLGFGLANRLLAIYTVARLRKR